MFNQNFTLGRFSVSPCANQPPGSSVSETSTPMGVFVFPGSRLFSLPPDLALVHGPGPQFVFIGPVPQFVFTSPSSQFVFTGLGPQFAFTSPGSQFLFTGPVLQFYYQSSA